MLEQESARIIETLTRHTIGARQSLSLAEVLSSDTPRPIKTYLRQEVYQWLAEDIASAPHFQRVQASAPAVARHLELFLRMTGEGYVFTRIQFLSLLENAVHFTLNYLCRPQRTLRSLLFDQNDSVPVELLRQKFGYVSEYPYLPTIIERVLRQRRWKEITESDFISLVRAIDSRIVREHSPRELAQLTRPIFDFLTTHTSSEVAVVPLHPLLAFFEDKEMIVVKDHIQRTVQTTSHATISIAQLTDFLEDLLGTPREASSPSSDQTAEKEPPESEPVQPEVVQHDQATTPPPEVTGDEPAREVQSEHQPPTEESPPEHSSVPEEQAILMPVELRNLREVINAEQRLRFIRTIFGKDASFYETLISKFNSMKTWVDTSLYLRDVFSIHNIDPFSPAAVEFTDALHQRFTGPQDPGQQ